MAEIERNSPDAKVLFATTPSQVHSIVLDVSCIFRLHDVCEKREYRENSEKDEQSNDARDVQNIGNTRDTNVIDHDPDEPLNDRPERAASRCQ